MQIPPRTTSRSFRAALFALSSLLLVTCTENPAGPGGAGLGTLRLAPVFDAFARFAPLTLDNIRVFVVRPATDTVARIARNFSATSPQLRLDLPVPIQGLSEDLEVTLQLFAGSALLFDGKDTVTVIAGGSTGPDSVPLVYRGLGGSIATLTLTPRDTSLQVGDSLTYLLNAADTQGVPVALYYVSWSLTGGPDRSTRLDATGRLRAPSKPDTFYVKVASPNGTVDSTSVTIIPRIAPGTVTWTGAVDSQWTTAGNWNTGALPSAVDSVVIPQATRHPVLTAPAAAGAINVTGGTLVLNGFTLTVARSFATSGTGTLTMTNQSDLLDVKGNARFNGGSTAGLLTAGNLTVGGSFTQLAGGSPQSFAADPGHFTELDAALPVISFATPGLTASHFGGLVQGFNGTGFSFATDIAVSGYINSQQDGFNGPLTGTNVALTVPSLSSMRLDGVRLVIEDTSTAGFSGVFGVQFSNLPTSATQLTIRSPGSAAGPFVVSGVTFVPLAGGNTGKYLNSIDADGSAPPLIVYVDFDANNNGPTFTQAGGGAQVFWPSTPFVWTGATSSDWATNTNWNSLRPPFSNPVIIPSGTPNSPQFLSFGATVTGLTLQPGATLDLGAQTITVNGNVDNDGLITGTSSSGVTVTGNLRGAIDAPVLEFGGSLSGRLTMGGGASMQVAGPFDLAGHTADITGDFIITGTGDLRMTSAGGTDSLLVGGNALFAGGEHRGAADDRGGRRWRATSRPDRSPRRTTRRVAPTRPSWAAASRPR